MSSSNIGSSSGGSSARPSGRPGSWQPLPYIYSGFAIHPYHPSPTPLTTPNARYQALGFLDGTATSDSKGGKVNAYEIPLDVGDEFFAFEEYKCGLEEDGRGDVWFRGYVVQAVSLTALSTAPGPSTAAQTPYPKPEPSVLIGIFPSSCVHVRPDASVDDGSLAAAYELAVQKAQDMDAAKPVPSWGVEMEAVKEEEEDDEGFKVGSPKTNGHNDAMDIPATTENRRSSVGGPGRTKRPKSLMQERKSVDAEEESKEQPPLPRLTAGDSTLAGQQYPLVDEIACAIREWYTRLPTYLANREYRLFSTVTQHIDALFLGRRQLLTQTLSVDELTRVRKECVSRLVKCNVAQGLEVIVRSLDDGSVLVVEKDRAYAGASWVGGIACYVYQIQLAYIDLIPLDTLLGKGSSLLPASIPPSISDGALSRSDGPTASSKWTRLPCHLLLDIHAFIANPCRPGETAELFFSLYNQNEGHFVTEEYCLILNHLGSPARESEQRLGRLRVLFTDLKKEDLGNSTYLVCRLVRNGALKMRLDAASGTLDSVGRGGTVRRPSAHLYSDMGTLRSTPSIFESTTDDSFSVTSGFGGHRTNTIETSLTTNASVVDGRPTFRRPLGCAAIDLPQLSKLLVEGDKAGLGVEVSMPIYVPKEEDAFATMHEDVVAKRLQNLLLSPRIEAIAVSLKAYQGPIQQVVRTHPSALADVPHAARLGFPDVAEIGEVRNDLYVKLWSGNFAPAPSSTGGSIRIRRPLVPLNHGNVQVTVELRRQDGTVISDAIFAGGTGEPATPFYHSLVFTNTDKPTFGEMIKVSLPPRAEECHLFLTFRSRGKEKGLADISELERPFACAYLPLVQDSACIKDGSHDLILYHMEKNLQGAPHLYYDSPSADATHGDGATATKNMTPLKDRISLRTYLCSNVHTQDDTLRALFHCQSRLSDLESIATMLQRFAFVSEDELSKFIPRTLDSLFGILVSNFGERQDELDDLVFQSLSKVLAMSSDRRFGGFAGLLETYITFHFNYPASSFHLLRAMKTVMSRPERKEYRSFLKVWHLFFRFIIRSRELDRARGIGLDATSRHIAADFQRQTKAILGEINTLMMSSDKSLIGTQTLAVQHYADILPDMAQVFPPLEIAELVIAFADTLTFAEGSIALYKLLLLLQVVKSVFDTSEARALLVPAIVRWVKPHLGRMDAVYVKGSSEAEDNRRVKWLECNRLAVTVVAWTINKLQEWHSSPLILEDRSLRMQEEDNLEYCLTLLPSLLESHVELSSTTTAESLGRARSSHMSIYKSSPDVFPMSNPFALLSELPPPSLLDKRSAAEDGLPISKTFVCGTVEITVVVFTLILAAPRHNVLRWLTELHEIEGAMTSSKILRSIFRFCTATIRNEAFPAQWLTLNLMCLSSVVRLLDPIAELLEHSFIPAVDDMETFDADLWRSLFVLLCDFCGNQQLELEDMTQQRRRAQWIIAGDLRDDGAGLLLRLWNAIGWKEGQKKETRYGGYQTRFTDMAGKILGLCLSSHDATCEAAVEILFSMIYAEYVLHGRFGGIQTEIFAKLDELFAMKGSSSATVSDPTSRAYFVAQLRAVFEASPPVDPTFQTEVGRFMDEIELFIDLLITLRTLPEAPEWKDERTLAVHRLTGFTQRIGRTDLYIRFIHQLVDIALESKDHLGAGYALRLHADVYDWNVSGDLVDEFAGSGLELPAQTQFERKEALLYHAMDHFVEAEAYEAALDVCQELTRQHQRTTYDLTKLQELLVHQAKLWEKIGSAPRPKPEYYRVAYFGDVNALNRGKDYVVRGRPWERYSDFCEAMQVKYPSSMIHRSKIPPPESVRHGDEPVIWVTSLAPEPDMSLPVFHERVSESVQSYHRHNGVKRFSSIRPYARERGEVDTVLTWTEKTIVTTAESLPGVLCRSEVVDITYEQISPIAGALNEVARATRLLRTMTHGTVDVKQLGNAINGAVDSPVNGGVKLYRSTFLDPSYVGKYSNEADQVEQLRVAIVDYVQAISDALGVHRLICRDVAFHEALRSHFHRAFADEIDQLPGEHDMNPSVLNAPLPPLPPTNGTKTHLRVPSRSARLSTLSAGSSGAYILPALRLGPSPSPTPSLFAVPASPPDPRNGSTPGTAVSSPRHSLMSGRGSRISTSTTSPPNPSAPPSLGTRALSIVGSISGSGKSRDSISEGTAEGVPVAQNGAAEQGGIASTVPLAGPEAKGEQGVNRGGTVSRKGLKRLSTLMGR